jgi:hypothetical protein
MTLPNEVKAKLEEGINDWLLNVDEIAEAGMIITRIKRKMPELELKFKAFLRFIPFTDSSYSDTSLNIG